MVKVTYILCIVSPHLEFRLLTKLESKILILNEDFGRVDVKLLSSNEGNLALPAYGADMKRQLN